MFQAKKFEGELWVRAKDVETIPFNKAQAAIALKVPMSGIPELDAMIRESRRLDMATAAMQGVVSGGRGTFNQFASDAKNLADALLAASGKDKP